MTNDSLAERDEITLNIEALQGVRLVLVNELAEIVRLTNEHIAACDQQIAALEAKRAEARAGDGGA